MDNIIYNGLLQYFNTLKYLGNINPLEGYKLLYLIGIKEFLDSDYSGFVTEKDYNEIVKSLYCIFGNSCIIPFPDYYQYKNNLMYKGTISELSNSIDIINDKIEELENMGKKPIVIPGDKITEIPDFDIK